MHYEQSQSEFLEGKKKILIYNKTRNVNNDIKNFRKKQYRLFLNSYLKKDKEEIQSDKVNIIKKKDNLNDKTTTANNNITNTGIINVLKNEESQPLSRASTIMNPSHKNVMNYGYKIESVNPKELFTDNNPYGEGKNKDKNKLSLNNKIFNNSKIKYSNKSIVINNDIKIIETTDIQDFQINENLLLSSLFCFFNIKYLREFIHNNFVKIETSHLYNKFSYIMNYLYGQIFTSENNVNYNKINEINLNLIRNCHEYNYEMLLEIIKHGAGKNIISKIINLLHLDLNFNFTNKNSKENNNAIDNKETSEYNTFINNIKQSNDSIIFDLFFGIKKTKKVCNKCNHEINKYKIINVFNISMEFIFNKYTKDKNRKKVKNNEDFISIEDCLDYSLEYSHNENYNEKATFFCSSCNNKTNYIKIKEISKFPEIVILYFFYNEYKGNIKIDFFQKLNLLNTEYALIGIISLDFNNEETNFISYCLEITSKKWFRINDYNIENIDMNNEKERIKNPIALFYQKINNI